MRPVSVINVTEPVDSKALALELRANAAEVFSFELAEAADAAVAVDVESAVLSLVNELLASLSASEFAAAKTSSRSASVTSIMGAALAEPDDSVIAAAGVAANAEAVETLELAESFDESELGVAEELVLTDAFGDSAFTGVDVSANAEAVAALALAESFDESELGVAAEFALAEFFDESALASMGFDFGDSGFAGGVPTTITFALE